jgi:diadenosine tetraphosphatase ApaH/serine/threonine PP2A family protein phosphatase
MARVGAGHALSDPYDASLWWCAREFPGRESNNPISGRHLAEGKGFSPELPNGITLDGHTVEIGAVFSREREFLVEGSMKCPMPRAAPGQSNSPYQRGAWWVKKARESAMGDRFGGRRSAVHRWRRPAEIYYGDITVASK